jgi:hypothetical protein
MDVKMVGSVLMGIAVAALLTLPLFITLGKDIGKKDNKVPSPVLSTPLANGELIYEVGQSGTHQKVKVYYFLYNQARHYLVVNEYNGGVAIK